MWVVPGVGDRTSLLCCPEPFLGKAVKALRCQADLWLNLFISVCEFHFVLLTLCCR